jgi:hypothetical protein
VHQDKTKEEVSYENDPQHLSCGVADTICIESYLCKSCRRPLWKIRLKYLLRKELKTSFRRGTGDIGLHVEDIGWPRKSSDKTIIAEDYSFAMAA